MVVLIDEYDAPVMAAHESGCYDEVVSFLKRWLTGALKSNDALAFAVLTGVQRISKESIFSDLNNLQVDTPLNVASDERFGFTQAEVEALAEYVGSASSVSQAREWYDGYRFGDVDVYNPWSVLNYFGNGCAPDVYWGNTSSNSVLGGLVSGADDKMLKRLYALAEPDGAVRAPLDTRVVFSDLAVAPQAVWSMLYLAGYLTTDDTPCRAMSTACVLCAYPIARSPSSMPLRSPVASPRLPAAATRSTTCTERSRRRCRCFRRGIGKRAFELRELPRPCFREQLSHAHDGPSVQRARL